MNNVLFLIGMTLMYSSPLIFTAIGGMITERSGVVNIGVDGLMTLGALIGASVGYFTGNPWLGFILAGLACMALSSIHAVASVTCGANQTVAGAAMNFLAPGIALFACKMLFNGSTSSLPGNIFPTVFGDLIPKDSDWSYLNIRIPVLMALILTVIVYFVMYKTKWGFRVRAVGEYPEAAETLGINVTKIRYICVMMSGLLAGFGGAAMTLSVVSQFSAVAVAGQGFIALAAVILGKWSPFGAYASCLLFGFAQALVVFLGGTNLANFSILLSMLPYALTIIALIIVGKSGSPKANGVPYGRNFR